MRAQYASLCRQRFIYLVDIVRCTGGMAFRSSFLSRGAVSKGTWCQLSDSAVSEVYSLALITPCWLLKLEVTILQLQLYFDLTIPKATIKNNSI